ncbi:MAG: T9SS type A sorting domain-containing protein [Bacteroidota bacterium]
MYHLQVWDQWMNVSADSIIVHVETIPPPPSAVSGAAGVCADTLCYYSVIQVPGATSYSWTVPSGAVIMSGQNTESVLVKWGNNSGTVSVIIGNNCGTSVPSVLPVNVTPIPSTTDSIDGPSHLCQYDTGNYQTDTILHTAYYNWIIPPDAMIISGAGTRSVRIKWGMLAGAISVRGENACGSGLAFSKTVSLDSLPGSCSLISGPDSVCVGKTSYNYSVAPVPFASSYGWTLPQGAAISSGQHTNRITVDFGSNAVSGPVTAFGINACGNGQASLKQIIVSNCSGTGESLFDQAISVSPNPVSGILNLKTEGLVKITEIVIYNQLGEILYRNHPSAADQSIYHQIDVSGFQQGLMFLKVCNESGSRTLKFIVR